MPKQKIELTLPATLGFSSLVRQVAEDVFSYVGFTKEWSGRLKLVVDELFMNANRYGSKENESKIFIEFTYDEKEVVFKIEDEGAGEKKLKAADLTKIIEKNTGEIEDVTKTSGRGLALISKLWTDEIMIEDGSHGGIMISFKKLISNDSPPAPPAISAVPIAQVEEKNEQQSPVVSKGPSETVKIVGEVDQVNMEEKIAPVLQKLENFVDGGTLTIDCSELLYFNSTFIGHLAAWHNQTQQQNGQLVLKNTNQNVKEVLDLVGLSRVIYLES